MAGDWIKVTHELPDKPEVWQIAQDLDMEPDLVVGKLIRVWTYFDKQTLDGAAPVIARNILDRIVNKAGFLAAMEEAGWIEEKNKKIHVVNFERHISLSAKERALTRNRVEKSRNGKSRKSRASKGGNAATVDLTVTDALPEKRREENISQDQKTCSKRTPLAYSDDFERIWLKRPPRAGSDSKKNAYRAFNARLKEGVTVKELEDGFDRYCLYIKAAKDDGSRFVMMVATFFGPAEHYLTPYNVTENINGNSNGGGASAPSTPEELAAFRTMWGYDYDPDAPF